jgi:hypothetical protein
MPLGVIAQPSAPAFWSSQAYVIEAFAEAAGGYREPDP